MVVYTLLLARCSMYTRGTLTPASWNRQILGISLYEAAVVGYIPIYQDIATESLSCICLFSSALVLCKNAPCPAPSSCYHEPSQEQLVDAPFLLSGETVDPAPCPKTLAFTFKPSFPWTFTPPATGTAAKVGATAAATAPVGGRTIWIADDGLDIIVQETEMRRRQSSGGPVVMLGDLGAVAIQPKTRPPRIWSRYCHGERVMNACKGKWTTGQESTGYVCVQRSTDYNLS
jgi:hypothetical protein